MIKKTLYKIFVPSWTATITSAPPTNPFADVLKPVDTKSPFKKKINVELFCHQILTANLSSSDLRTKVRRNIKIANFYIYALLVFILAALLICFQWLSEPTFTFLEIEPTWLLVITFTCCVQMVRLICHHLHRAKQIVVGCAFPKHLMITSPRNIIYFYEGVYVGKRLVHNAFPFIDNTLEALKEAERKAAHDRERKGESS